MKQKLTITVDADLLPLAKRYAAFEGCHCLRSSSSLCERLRESTPRPSPLGGAESSRQPTAITTLATMRWPGNTSNDPPLR